MTWPEKKNLMEIKLFKYRCVVSLKTPFQCCSGLKTKALLHKEKKNSCVPTILSAEREKHFSYCSLRRLSGNAGGRSLSSLPCCPSQWGCAGSQVEDFVGHTPFQQGKQAAVLCLAAALFIQEIPSIGIKHLSLDERTPEQLRYWHISSSENWEMPLTS